MMHDPMVLVTHWDDGGLNTAAYRFPDDLDTFAQDVKAAANTLGVTRMEVILSKAGSGV